MTNSNFKPHENPSSDAYDLIALGEYFRQCNPPKLKLSLKCLMSTLHLNTPPNIKAECLYLTGKTLLLYTTNFREARQYLEIAYIAMKEIGSSMEIQRFEVVCLLAETMMDQQRYEHLKKLLRDEVAASIKHPKHNAKLILLLAECHARLNDTSSALYILNTGCEHFQKHNHYLIEAFTISAQTILLSQDPSCSPEDMTKKLTRLEQISRHYPSEWTCVMNLRVFCCAIQLCYLLSRGLLQSAKNCLKQLQTLVGVLASRELNLGNYEQNGTTWKIMSPEMFTAVTYTLTFMTNIMACNYEKVNKYYHIALNHLEEIRKFSKSSPYTLMERGTFELVEALEVVLYENMAQCNLVLARPSDCIQVVTLMLEKLKFDTTLQDDFKPAAHLILGMYCTFMYKYVEAEKQFLEVINKVRDKDVYLFANSCLALLYVLTNREIDYFKVYGKIIPNKVHTHSIGIKFVTLFACGFHAYIVNRISDCRGYMNEIVDLAKEDNLFRIMSMALLMLAQIFESQEIDTIKKAYQYTATLGDNTLTIWLNKIIMKMHRSYGRVSQAEVIQQATIQYINVIAEDRQKAESHASNSYINWTEGHLDFL
uniref:MAU2 chromatid cohesion factor homolog n=1 Tax=Strongyloides stercoralis TaxID=6248 RepID=A0A0K0ERW6_STRER